MNVYSFKEPNNDSSTFYYQEGFLNKNEIKNIRKWLDSLQDFKINPSFNNNKIARYQKWYQMEGNYFCPKWEGEFDRWKSFNYDKGLIKIQSLIIDKLQKLNLDKIDIDIPLINSCLVNKYPDGSHYIRPHRDTDLAFGKEPVIVGVSIGETREIIFNRLLYNGSNRFLSKKDKANSHLDFSLKLKNGSLFIMSGSSQKYWSHEVPPSNSDKCRYSLTFRQHIA